MKKIFSEYNQLVGIVLQANNPRYVTFLANRDADLSHGTILGLQEDDGCAVLCMVVDISYTYYLKDPKRFFSGFSAENKLNIIVKGSENAPQYTQEIKARVMGRYFLNDSKVFCLSPDSVDLYSPKALQGVYKLNPSLAMAVFGLYPSGLKLGRMQYPFNVEITVSSDTFKRHILVSGVTGAGKSRLVGAICKKFSQAGGCITIIDPHDEYSNILAADSLIENIHRYEIAPCFWSPKHWQMSKNAGENQKVFEMPLILSESQLTPSSLCQLLPNITEQQKQEIYNLFYKAKELDGSIIDNLKQLLISACKALHPKSETVRKSSRPNRSDVLKAIINKLSFEKDDNRNVKKITEKIYLTDRTSLWQEPFEGRISILCGDYNKEGTGKRFLAAIFEQFLRRIEVSPKIGQLLVIEEAHHIFKLQEDSVKISLAQLLREARKFGITLLLVTQNTFDIPEDIRTQFQNLFSFRELSVDENKYLEEKCCRVKLYGGKSEFIMMTDECISLVDSTS